MTDDQRLISVLADIRERGAIGEASLEDAIAHADQYVSALSSDVHTVADLGSGGGLPGLVLVIRRPDLHVVLVERRQARADLLRRAVSALAVTDRVEVVSDDVAVVAADRAATFDAVTARSFAAPPVTARWAAALLRPGGVLVVSEPPVDSEERWPDALLDQHGLVDLGRTQGVRRFRRR